jgi:hypothetical protein
MKAMMLVVLVGLVGCAGNNDALKARVATLETENKNLTQEVVEIKNETGTCDRAMAVATHAEKSVAEQASRFYEAAKEMVSDAKPGAKKKVADSLDSLGEVFRENADKAVDASKKWAREHNFTK